MTDHERAEKLLPCHFECGSTHRFACPAYRRPATIAAFREVATKARAEERERCRLEWGGTLLAAFGVHAAGDTND